MKYINKYINFKLVKESINNESVIDSIIETMLEFIDADEKISFQSPSSSYGGMTYQDYLSKNDKYYEFIPVNKTKNKIVSRFSIVYHPKNNNYNGFVELMDNMKPTIGRLSDMGWVLYDFITESSEGLEYGREGKISNVEFIFTKPDVMLNDDVDLEAAIPDEDELRESFQKLRIPIDRLRIEDYETIVDFRSNDYDGRLNSENWYEVKFKNICDIFGFSSYDLEYHKARVTFEH